MKKKQKLKIEVEVWDIEVEETQHYDDGQGSGWWKFEYSIKIDKRKKEFGTQDGSWGGQTKRHFNKVLKEGYALQKVLEDLTISNK